MRVLFISVYISMCLLVYISYLSGLILVLTTALHAVNREALYSSSFSVFHFTGSFLRTRVATNDSLIQRLGRQRSRPCDARALRPSEHEPGVTVSCNRSLLERPLA